MTKDDAFKQFCKIQEIPTKYETDPDVLREFEIDWESGYFNEETKGECCS